MEPLVIFLGYEEHIPGQTRDWNEELQTTRELPRKSLPERLLRERAVFKVQLSLHLCLILVLFSNFETFCYCFSISFCHYLILWFRWNILLSLSYPIIESYCINPSLSYYLVNLSFNHPIIYMPFRTDLGLGLPNLQTSPVSLMRYVGVLQVSEHLLHHPRARYTQVGSFKPVTAQPAETLKPQLSRSKWQGGWFRERSDRRCHFCI